MATMTTYTLASSALGSAIPPNLPHAISVSLPTWQDVVDYEEGRPRVMDVMENGYPRFFIHLTIQKLARICEEKFGTKGERAILFPTLRIASACKAFILSQSPPSTPLPPIRLTHLSLSPPSSQTQEITELHIVFFPADTWPLAKAFWQHTGLGVSSRMAERCLALWTESESPVTPTPTTAESSPEERHTGFIWNRRGLRSRYGRKPPTGSISSPPLSPLAPSSSSPTSPLTPSPPRADDTLGTDQSVYLEERYGRNLPLAQASLASLALRRRIAGTLLAAGGGEGEGREVSGRGVSGLSEEDVWLFPTGMSAIWYAHQLALAARPEAKSVCFGFPYTDTLKILQKWGPGCHFFGHGTDSDLDLLEAQLSSPTASPILALFCEFPSNPLLRSADLRRLRALADKHGFLVVIDETIGSFVNVEVLPYADVLVSSLTKVFSGETNVMGGSLVLNPSSASYAELKKALPGIYEDTYWPEDAIFMERNSRNFVPRVRQINESTEAVCEFLHAAIGKGVITSVMYPKYETREHYDACRLPVQGGYGGLFSIIFTSQTASQAFFDALPCEKGPSLGTNFTLACPYTVIAHYAEQEWANAWGVDSSLVRVSVGLEEVGTLLEGFGRALRAAEEAVKAQE